MALPRVRKIRVDRIRPEEGLGRQRDREGHLELCRSIEQFGVLTPIAVRPAPGARDEYLLIKGQGRTLACKFQGIKEIPAIVLPEASAEAEKVQQFLVENVARLRMKPVDRALLIAHARREGEETVDVARRFAVTPATVRRLEAQLDGASSGEIATLRSGDVKLAVHAVIARHVPSSERESALEIVARYPVTSKELESLLVALGWRALTDLGSSARSQRIDLLEWACATLAALPRGAVRDRLRELGQRFPMKLERTFDMAQDGRG